MKKTSDILKIKGGSYNLQAIRFLLKTVNLFDIKNALKDYIGNNFDMFSYDDVVLDFSQISDEELVIFQNQYHLNWNEWKSTLRSFRLNLLACTGFKDFKNISQNLVENSSTNDSEQSPNDNNNNSYRDIEEIILELRRNNITYLKTNKIENHNKNNNNNEKESETVTEIQTDNTQTNNAEDNTNNQQITTPIEIGFFPTKYINNDIRGGTEIMEKGNIIICGNVNSGAQIVSFSDIFVFGELRGKIFAGGQDNISARIITSNFNPELIAIAGVFKTFENGIPEEYLNKSVCVSLEEDEENDVSRLKIDVIKL